MTTMIVSDDQYPDVVMEFDEVFVARATKRVREQLAELRATDNFVGVVYDAGVMATVNIDFGEVIGVRDVLVDPMGIRKEMARRISLRHGAPAAKH